MDNIRPIALGSPMGRAIGKLLANRLGALLVYDTSMLDPAQNAFLPGKDIHGPISVVTQCYKQSKATANGQEREGPICNLL
jgi:hypothetical protein